MERQDQEFILKQGKIKTVIVWFLKTILLRDLTLPLIKQGVIGFSVNFYALFFSWVFFPPPKPPPLPQNRKILKFYEITGMSLSLDVIRFFLNCLTIDSWIELLFGFPRHPRIWCRRKCHWDLTRSSENWPRHRVNQNKHLVNTIAKYTLDAKKYHII